MQKSFQKEHLGLEELPGSSSTADHQDSLMIRAVVDQLVVIVS